MTEPRCESTGVFLCLDRLAFVALPVHMRAMSNDNTPKPASRGRPTAADTAAGASARPCPLCRKPSLHAFRPFCSKRCADLDLSRWLNGVYAVPAAPTDDGDDEAEQR